MAPSSDRRRKTEKTGKPTKSEKTSETSHERDLLLEDNPSRFNRLLRNRWFFLLLAGFFMYTMSRHRPEFSNEYTMAYQHQVIQRRSGQVPCSDDYQNETLFKDCLPKICGRVITDMLLTEDETDQLLSLVQKGMKLGGSSGGASIMDLHSGALSKDDSFIDIFQLSQGKSLFTERDFNTYRTIKNKIHIRIAAEFGSFPNQLYLTKPTFFSRMTPKPPKTIHDEYWHIHVDKETYESFHYTSLVYLNNYGEDFTGGRFVFVDKDGVNRTVEPRKGRVSMFTSGSENPHFVERVTSGERFALTVSFTCNPAHSIPDIQPR